MAASTTVEREAREGQDLHAARTCAEGEHRLRVLGYLHGPGGAGLDCDKPLRVVCRSCDFRTVWACSGHRESRCRPCAARYRRRVRAVAESGLRRRPGGFTYLLTLTAPGRRAHRLPDGSPCRCTPQGGVDLAEWNASHSARWNHFRTRLRSAHPDVQYFRGVEVQLRGGLHDHAMVHSDHPLSLRWLRELAMDCGFGHSVDLAPCAPGSKRAAYYVAKYVTKATDSRDLVPWAADVVDEGTGEISRGVVAGRYRTWSMSREWGSTMAQVRAIAAAYARVKAGERADREEVEALRAVLSVLGPVVLLPTHDPPVDTG